MFLEYHKPFHEVRSLFKRLPSEKDNDSSMSLEKDDRYKFDPRAISELLAKADKID